MRPDLDYVMPAKEDFARAAQIAQEVFEQVSQQFKGQGSDRIREATKDLLLTNFSRNKVLGLDMEGGQLVRFVQRAVNAFFDQDLLAAVRFFLANAKGSFGLCITCSLDAHRQLVVAARGQTISVAFYPNSGLILWGSEQAAVKAALVGEKHTHTSPMIFHDCAALSYHQPARLMRSTAYPSPYPSRTLLGVCTHHARLPTQRARGPPASRGS